MNRTLTLLVLGGLTFGLVLAAPAVGHAQVIVPGPGYYSPGCTPGYGVNPYGYTPGYGGYNNYYPYGGYGNGGYGYGGYNNYYPYGDYSNGGYGYGGYGQRRPVIVHPGHIHVPHRGHYHTRPY